jgi:hypothetical protein
VRNSANPRITNILTAGFSVISDLLRHRALRGTYRILWLQSHTVNWTASTYLPDYHGRTKRSAQRASPHASDSPEGSSQNVLGKILFLFNQNTVPGSTCQPISGPRFRRDARSFEVRGPPSPSSTHVPLTLNDPFWYGMLVFRLLISPQPDPEKISCQHPWLPYF